MKTEKLEKYLRENTKPQLYTKAVSDLFKKEKFEEAEELALEGLENFPKDKSLWSQYGEILCAFGEANDLIQAVRAYEKAIQLGGGKQVDLDALDNAKKLLREKTPILSAVFEETATPRIYMAIARKRRDDDKEEEAVKFLEEAVTVFPDDKILWYRLGKSYAFMNENGDAIKAFQTALEIDPNDDQTKQALQETRTRMNQGRHFHR